MPATARDIIKQIIEIYPVKDQPTRKDINWQEAIGKKEDILLEFDFDGYTRLYDELVILLPDVNFILEFGSRFGTQNIISGAGINLKSEESYYLTTGCLFGVRLKTHDKFQLEERLTLNKTGYHFVVDPMGEHKHPANAIARATIKRFLFELYGCQTDN